MKRKPCLPCDEVQKAKIEIAVRRSEAFAELTSRIIDEEGYS